MNRPPIAAKNNYRSQLALVGLRNIPNIDRKEGNIPTTVQAKAVVLSSASLFSKYIEYGKCDGIGRDLSRCRLLSFGRPGPTIVPTPQRRSEDYGAALPLAPRLSEDPMGDQRCRGGLPARQLAHDLAVRSACGDLVAELRSAQAVVDGAAAAPC